MINLQQPTAGLTAPFEQFPMHVDQVATACPFMQVVDVLGDQQNLSRPGRFEPCQGLMRGIGLDGSAEQLLAAGVIELLHHQRVAKEGFGCGHIFDPVVFPQAV